LRFAQDGSFRIDDVPSGKYQLTIDLREQVLVKGQTHSPLIDLHRQEIEVPDPPNARSDSPLDLGVIRLVAQLNQGEMAPDFSYKTGDDKNARLSDYRGKFVLLNFWTASNTPSWAGLPDLKDTYAAYKNDARFSMIGLNLDTNVAAARAYSSENHADWSQGFLGAWAESDVPDRYGVESLPFAVLIDPTGRVVATGLHGSWIKANVDAALSVHE